MYKKARIQRAVPDAAVFMISLCLMLSPFLPITVAADTTPLQQHVKSHEATHFVTRAVFKNGMTVLVDENRAHPVVSIQVFVNAGTFEEPAESPGLASVLASLIYRGGKDKSQGTLWQNARILGGFLSSSTGYGYTRFEITAPASQWKKALQVQSGAFLNFNPDPDSVQQETGLIREKALARLDIPSVSARELLLNLGFNSARMGPWTAVLKSEPGAVSYKKLAAFHKEMYVPERMMLVVSGDINAIEVLNEAARLYGDFTSKGSSGYSIPVSLSQNGFRYQGIEGKTRASHLLFGFHTPGVDSGDYAALEVLNAILGLGNGSILAARLRDQKKLVYEGGTELDAYPGFGYLAIRIKSAPEDMDRCEIAVFTELELLKRKEPDKEDMERAMAQIERMYRSRIQTVSGRAEMLAHFESWGDWKRIDRHLSGIRKVRAEDIKRVAAKYLRLENCSLLEYVPEGFTNKARNIESVQRTLEALLKPSTDEEQVKRTKETVLAFDIPEDTNTYRYSRVQYPFKTASVLRGPDIFIREDHTTPLIHIGLFFPGGKLAETEENTGITELMVRTMLQGSQKRDAYRFYRQLEIYGGQLQPVVTDDYFGFYFSIISKNFRPGFKLLMEAVESPLFDEEGVDRQKALLQTERMMLKDRKDIVDAAVFPILFNGFPYSRGAFGTAESLKSITAESLKDWYGIYVRNRKPLAVIVGDSEGTSLASYFVREFSGSRFRETEIPDAFAEVPDKKETIETTWDKGLGLIAVGFQAPPLGDEAWFAAIVLQSYLGKSGRIYHELRDRSIIAPEVRLSYEPMLRGGSFVAYAVVNPGSEEEALNVLEQAFTHAVTGPYAFRDYRSAVNTADGGYLIRQQIPFQQITDVTRNILAGEGIDGYRSFRDYLRDVRQEEMKNAAERIFKIERAVILRIYSNSLDDSVSKVE